MKKFRVFGSNNKLYWTVVTANNEYEAYEIAQNDSITWFEVENDSVIRPTDVFAEDDEYDPKAAAREYYRTKDELEIS
jgi:hypothetical protein